MASVIRSCTSSGAGHVVRFSPPEENLELIESDLWLDGTSHTIHHTIHILSQGGQLPLAGTEKSFMAG